MTEKISRYCEVNSVRLHYEVCGSGYPIILLHGNGENLHIFDILVEKLAKDYTVYALDTRGHGLSSPIDEFHYHDMVEDVYQFIGQLDLNKPMLYGFSDGGIVGLLLAINHCDSIVKLAISGANYTPYGLKPIFRVGSKVNYFLTKSKFSRLMIEEPNIDEKQLRSIPIPTLVMAGSKDVIIDSHTQKLASLIPQSQLYIFHNESHSSYVKRGHKLYPILSKFFL